tara:strand:- start:336 stop:776 length:441 start_codon:yes stop_codon:yes gene_type:complete
MALKFSQIRSAFATQISTISGFNLCRQLPDYFGRTRESIAHKAFSVGISQTNQIDAERQRRSVGVYADSSVQVKFAYRLRPLDVYPTDYDLALDAEELVINKCLSSYASIRPEVQVRYLNSDRVSTESSEYMIHTIDFQVLHTIGE